MNGFIDAGGSVNEGGLVRLQEDVYNEEPRLNQPR